MSYSEDFEVQKYFANMKNSHAPPCAFFLNEELLNQEQLEFP